MPQLYYFDHLGSKDIIHIRLIRLKNSAQEVLGEAIKVEFEYELKLSLKQKRRQRLKL